VKLEQYPNLKALERTLEDTMDTLCRKRPFGRTSPELDGVTKVAHRARTKLRNAVRKIADKKETFSAERNGTAAFETWQDGFNFASSIPEGTDAVYFHRMTADVVFFYKKETLAQLAQLLPKFYEMVKEVQDLAAVIGVHLS